MENFECKSRRKKAIFISALLLFNIKTDKKLKRLRGLIYGIESLGCYNSNSYIISSIT